MVQGVDVEPEVDFDLLAEKTAGYSGDDITGVCRDAAMNGMRRKIMGKTPEQIRCSLRVMYSMISVRNTFAQAAVSQITVVQLMQC